MDFFKRIVSTLMAFILAVLLLPMNSLAEVLPDEPVIGVTEEIPEPEDLVQTEMFEETAQATESATEPVIPETSETTEPTEPVIPETTEATVEMEPEPVCTCESDDRVNHAPFCEMYVEPENPECFCAEKCTADAFNEWCDVCAVDAASCQGIDVSAVYIPSGYTAISTPEQLDNIRNNLSGRYILTRNIDMSAALAKGGSLYDANGWIAIGYLSSNNSQPFTGVLDGNGYTISGLTAKGGGGVAHLIRTNQGTIKNLTISGDLNGGGVFCAYNEGLIQNCHNEAAMTLNVYTSSALYRGGLVNTNRAGGVIEFCSNQADISGTVNSNGGSSDKELHIGGIAGNNSGTIRKCYNIGDMNGVAKKYTSIFAAGIAGYGGSNSTIENCYNTGKVYAKMSDTGYNSAYNIAAAGILASVYNQYATTIKYCYNVGNISMSSGYHNDYLGAIAGYQAKSTFTNCYYLTGSCSQATYSGEKSSIVKLTENQMRNQNAFTGFDFLNTWTMGSGGYYYPVLKMPCPHEVTKVNAKPATCTSNGNIEYWYCAVCDRYFFNSSKGTEITRYHVILYGGHNYTTTVTPPSCTEGGYTTHTCSACGDSYVDSYVEATGHNYQDGVCTVCGDGRAEVTYTYGQSAQIKLIEPWGLKANAKISTAAGVIDYSQLHDYGVYFIRKSTLDRVGLTQETITAEDILSDSDALKKTKADGVTVNGAYLTAIYDRDIYTYELSDSIFVMFYFVTEEGADPIYVPIRERNLKDLAEARKDDATGFPNEKERIVYGYMVDLFNAITDYREDYFRN